MKRKELGVGKSRILWCKYANFVAYLMIPVSAFPTLPLITYPPKPSSRSSAVIENDSPLRNQGGRHVFRCLHLTIEDRPLQSTLGASNGNRRFCMCPAVILESGSLYNWHQDSMSHKNRSKLGLGHLIHSQDHSDAITSDPMPHPQGRTVLEVIKC